MAERVRITVRASPSHPDILTIQDAMQQVLGFFELLNANAKEGDEIVWKLVSAQTHSPEITVEGEATSIYASVDVSIPARAQKISFANNFRSVLNGNIPKDWRKTYKAKLAEEFIERNTNGVGFTEIFVDPKEPPISLDRNIARQSVEKLKLAPVHQFRAHQEVGSIEGVLYDITTYQEKPSIKVREYSTRNSVTCIISEEMRQSINDRVHPNDVWKHNPVIVRGSLMYNDKGEVFQVIADEVLLKEKPKRKSLDDIYDPHFTSGLSASEYLDRLREGSL